MKKNIILKNKGFTIIELLIVIVIMGIIVMTTSNLFISGINFYSLNKDKAEIQRELRFITNYIDENLKYTSDIEKYNSSPSTPDLNYTGIGFNNTSKTVKIYKSDGSTYNLSQIKLDNFEFSNTKENILNLYIQKDNFIIDTNILLNNFTFNLTSTNNTFISFKN